MNLNETQTNWIIALTAALAFGLLVELSSRHGMEHRSEQKITMLQGGVPSVYVDCLVDSCSQLQWQDAARIAAVRP